MSTIQSEPATGLRRLPAPLAAGLLPALAAAAVSANILSNGFVYDDTLVFGQLGGGWALWRELAFPSGALPRALQLADYWLWGDWAPGFRLTSLLLHALASFLAAHAALLVSGSRRIGAICGLLFAVHPAHMEAVASFANLDQLLAMIFVCLALALWLDPDRRASRYLASLACVALAFASEELTTAGFVPMLFACDLLLRPDAGPRIALRAAVLRSAPLWLATVVVGFALAGDPSSYFESDSIFRETEGIAKSYPEVLATALASLPDVFRLLFFPAALSADHPVHFQSGFAEARALIGAGSLVGWLAVSLALRRRAPLATFAMVWIVVGWLPRANLVPITNYFVAERFLYVPSFGACLLVALGVEAGLRASVRQRRVSLRWGLVGVLALALLAASARSVARNRDWRSPNALATSALASGMDTWRMRRMAAQVNSQSGDHAQASFHLRRAVELAPMFPELQLELATALLYDGRMFEAAEQIDLANARGPTSAWAAASSQNLGVALALKGFPEAAVDQYQRSLEIEPDNADAHHNLAVSLASGGDLPQAIRHYRRALELQPERADAHHNLGIALATQGELEAAIGHYREALLRAPGRPGVHHALGTALALQHRPDEAIPHYRRALEQDPRDTDAHHNLAVALAAQGELDEAIEHYQTALQLDPAREDARRNLAFAVALREQGAGRRPPLVPEPRYVDAHHERGAALASQGQLDEAIWHYQQTLVAWPESADVHYALAVAFEQQLRHRDAARHYRRALRAAPERADVHNSLAWLLATSAASDVRDPEEAIRIAERAVGLGEDPDPNHLDTLAAAYAAAGRFDDATRTAERAFSLALAAQDDELAADIHGRLFLYREEKPYRGSGQAR